MTDDGLQTAAPASSDLTLEQIPRGIVLLNHLAAVRVEGEDAESFLHSQFTNDVLALRPGGHQLGAYCNPKGRAIAVFRLLRDDAGFYLVLPQDLVDTVVKRLTLFRMRAKASIEVNATDTLVGAFGLETESTGQCWRIDATRSLCLASPEDLSAMAKQYEELPLSTWQLGEILALEPQVYAATSEEFIPQQVNLDLVDGVSFSKGCYPGQEIIARVRYLGKIKQRMLAGRIDNESVVPAPGDPIFTVERPDQKSGLVVDAVSSGEHTLITAMVPAALLQGGELHLGAADGARIMFTPPPYDITTEREK